MTAAELRAWRAARGWSQAQAYAWYMGMVPLACEEPASAAERAAMARTWRRWELGERAVPMPLEARIRESEQRAKRSRGSSRLTRRQSQG